MTFTADRIATHGWKFWMIAPAYRALVPPMAFATTARVAPEPIETATISANCPHGNTPPSDLCPCGIHFVAGRENFIATARRLFAGGHEVQYGRGIVAATLGTAIGPVLEDLREDEWWGEQPYRAAGYQIKGILLEPNNQFFGSLAARYKVPIQARGINAKQARILEDKATR